MTDVAERYLVLDLARIFRKHFRDEPTVGDSGSPFMAFVLAVAKESDIEISEADVLKIARQQGYAEEGD